MERKLKRRVYPILALQLAFAEPPVSLPVPVDGVRPSAIRNSWRAIRDGGRHHQGIDIFANPEPGSVDDRRSYHQTGTKPVRR